MPLDTKGHRILPGDSLNLKSSYKCVAEEAITVGQIVCVNGRTGKLWKVNKASSLVAAEAGALLLIASSGAASGKSFRCVPVGALENQDTSGLTVGDPVYLGGTAGSWSTTRTGFARAVGTVQVVSATVGVISFNGVSVSSGRTIWGSGTILSGQTSLTIAAATLGGVYGGKRVMIQAREIPTNATVYIVAATWSTNDLVVTASGDPGASNLDFDYMIQVS